MDSSTSQQSDRWEIVFFDLETTMPWGSGQPRHLLEFGAILVCPHKLAELDRYTTLIRPSDLSAVSAASMRCDGITRDMVASAPPFREVAAKVYDILNGRVWAGHNILRFDCVRIREAFANIGLSAPEPKGIIDTYTLLTHRFGKRAGNMKMATLAAYFGLGEQPHRSLADVEMNLEVVKYCSTVLFLEDAILAGNSLVSPDTIIRSHESNIRISNADRSLHTISPLTFENDQEIPPLNAGAKVTHLVDCNMQKPEPLDMDPLIDQIEEESKPDAKMEENCTQVEHNISANAVANEGSSSYVGFLDPDEVSVVSVSASLCPSYWGQRIQLMHKDAPLQLCCAELRLRYGVNKKFVDSAGRPRMTIVVDAPSSLCQVLDVCDYLAQKMFVDSGRSSTWRPVVIRKNDSNTSSIRLNIPTIANMASGDNSVYTTEMHLVDSAGTSHRLVFNRFDPTQLDPLFHPGALIDTFFSLEVYDYQQSAGIRLVAKRLFIYSN